MEVPDSPLDSPADSPLDSPFCKHLRSKKWYFRTGPPQTADDLLDASNHCWCGGTSEALGRDGETANPEYCVRGRTCFEPYFAGSSAQPGA